jgi:hypothetical protein
MMPYAVQNLIEGRGEPIFVEPNDSVQDALDLMIEHEYSQLPVVDEGGKPLGVVTHESILRALNNFGARIGELNVSNAFTARVQTYRPEDDLFELLDRLKETNAVLIVDGDDRLIGIVSSYDSTEYFRRRAEDMMLVEDIEGMIKDLVQAAFTDDSGEVDQEQLRAAMEEITSSKHALMGQYRNALRHYLRRQGEGKPSVDSQSLEESFAHFALKEDSRDFEELTLYEYTELLLHKKYWDLFHPIFDLSREALRKLLDSVRETRNSLAHFRGEISPTQRDQLKFCAELFARYPAERVMQHLIGIPVSWPAGLTEIPVDQTAVQERGVTYETSTQLVGEIAPTEEALGPSDSRYAPLALRLQSQPSNQDRVQLTFEEIEKIIDNPLPASARQHRSWWANDSVSHVQSQQWLDVGWRVAQINMTEEKVTFARIQERERAYIDFFSALQDGLRQTNEFPLRPISPDGQGWLTTAGLPEGGPLCLFFNFAFGLRKRFRVELYINAGDRERNKLIFDWLHNKSSEIDGALGEELSWERLDQGRASRIAIYHPGSITDDEETLAQLRAWAADAMLRFYRILAGPANRALLEIDQSGV